MRKVQRQDIVDYVTYGERRTHIRARAMLLKAPRRIHVGPHLTFLFENTDTIVYQIQEMMRAEQIVKEAEIQHEIETYNELVGGPGQLGCTLMIEIGDEALRAQLLEAWLPLLAHLYTRLPDGTLVRPTYDDRQIGDTRLSSVQYLVFDTGGVPPLAVGSDFDAYRHETELTQHQHAALSEDLAG